MSAIRLSLRPYRLQCCVKYTSTVESNQYDDKVTKIKNLYKAAFSLTKGRPSMALLNALNKQARLDGVEVTGAEIEQMEYDELTNMNKSQNSKIRQFRGSGNVTVGLLNVYLDMYLKHRQLENFELTLERASSVPLNEVDQSLLLRYLMECKKVKRVPRVNIEGDVKVISTMMGFYYSKMFLQLRYMKDRVTQELVDSVIYKYSFIPETFTDLKAAIKLINPNIQINVKSECRPLHEIEQVYPIIRNLLPRQDDEKSYRYNLVGPLSDSAVKTQLHNENKNFTRVISIADSGRENRNIWDYKDKLQEQWITDIHKALIREVSLFKKGDHKDFRVHYCPILDDNIINLRSVAEATVKYVCEEMIVQYEGLEVGDITF